jgi:predicted ATPase
MLKIVLTGGPCSGKTVLLNRLTQILEERGYKVYTVFEAATALIVNGIYPTENMSPEDFQSFVLDMQLNNENLFEKVAKFHDPNKIIIFYDRGIMDGCAYVDKETVFKNMLAKKGLTFSDIYSRYDAVLHLLTTADGAEEYYQWNDPTKEDVGNNVARSESPEEARDKDRKTLNAWIGHPRLRVFDNSTDFDGKINRVIKEVFALVGEPVPSEIERKFLIKMPTKEQIESLGCVSKTNIIQTYLKKSGNIV